MLSEFRTRLVSGCAEQRLLDAVLDCCRQRGWLKARGRQRTDSTQILARVRAVNRLECVTETVRAALNSPAVVAPAWLRAQSPAEWLERYGRRRDDSRLPAGQEERRDYAHQVGNDGYALLAAVAAAAAPAWLREVPAVETLRRVWLQQFYVEAGQVRGRTAAEGIPPSALFISSPYDVEARYAKKHTTTWVGYRVDLLHDSSKTLPERILQLEGLSGHKGLAIKALNPILPLIVKKV